ncbi:hypothetical protein BME20236_I0267 [Brucella melitensis]|nr:hypothetical protein BME20236_I0267 [Brucella melitensis]ENQ72803.1 hypothetical protein C963_01307 [Brucella melitensis CNGB 1120]AOG52135.1 hypothetical protein BFS11_01280 [Brucella melitensis]ODN40888.1 hypothetical protein BGC40_10610 [Brucella melitensis]OHY08142.1 hypothetical protein BGK42_12850 [Brucella melitensis]
MPPITLKEYLTGLPVKEGYEESDGSPVMGDANETVSETPNEPARTGSDFPANKKTGMHSQRTATMKTRRFRLQHQFKRLTTFSLLYSAQICADCMNVYWMDVVSG